MKGLQLINQKKPQALTSQSNMIIMRLSLMVTLYRDVCARACARVCACTYACTEELAPIYLHSNTKHLHDS